MNHLVNWQMLLFVGASLIHDYWVCSGLPRIYYWDLKKQCIDSANIDDDTNNIA